MTREKADILRYRMAKAREVLEDAGDLVARKRLTSAMNRIYYSMFYSAIAILATRNLSSARHSGTIALLFDNFVKTGSFPTGLARQLAIAFDLRSESDYKDFVAPTDGQAQEMLESAREFVAKAEELVEAAISSQTT